MVTQLIGDRVKMNKKYNGPKSRAGSSKGWDGRAGMETPRLLGG
jgi:hypothetical protein